MRIHRSFAAADACRGGYVSIGNFDGVHRGHRQMVRELADRARGDSAPSVVLTFDPHPLRLLAPERAPPLLTTLEDKAELLGECGIDCLIAYPTDDALLALAPREFFDRVLRDQLQARGLVEGPNFCFGRGRAGTVETLRQYCDEAGMSLTVAAPVSVGGRLVSSSAIRAHLAAGEFDSAVEMLGHPYRIAGRVVPGAGRGRTLGFGTANLADMAVMLPADGVYAGLAAVDSGTYAAAVHIGPNPTFKEGARKLEVHLIDFAGHDLYGSILSVDLKARLRGTMSFAGIDALRMQLEQDIQTARRLGGLAPAAAARRPAD